MEISCETPSEKNVELGINDSIAVFLPEDLTFIEGIEVRVQIPPDVSDWRDSVACAVYDSVSPRPSAQKIDYSGKRIFLMPLPSKVNWIMQIPMKEKFSLKDSSYITRLGIMPDLSSGNIFIRFMPVMKGVPDETLNASLNVFVKPVLLDKGKLVVYLNFPDKKNADTSDVLTDILIDDRSVSLDKNGIILDSGMHNLTVQSEKYRTEVRAVYIDRAKVTECRILMKSLAPTVSVSAPDNVSVFFDDKIVDKTKDSFEISEGEHRLRFVMGSYEIIRTINAVKGKSYNAELSVDLQITEE